jgi:hypothetical protein
MKKRKLRDEIQSYESMWLTLWRIVARQPGETCELIPIVSDRMHSLRTARRAARLWKRAAKRYRREAVAPHTWSEADKMREERDDVIAIERALREDYYRLREECDGQRCIVARLTKERDDALANRDGAVEALGDKIQQLEEVRAERDAARAELASMRKDRDAVNEDCATLKAERDDAIRAADSRHAKLVEVADKLRASRVDVDILQKAMARMRPVVEACETSYDEGWLVGNVPVSRAVEAYRAGGDDSGDVVQVTIDDKGIIRALDGDYVGVFEKPAPDIPDIQRTYRAPDNDTAERIADDVTSTEPPAIPAWVVRRRIEALVDDGIRGSMLRIAIACDIHEASGHVVDDIAEAIERLKRDRSLLAATPGEARKLEADAFAYRKHFRAVASAIGAHITEDEWEEMTPATAGRVAEEVDAAQPEPAEPTPAAPVHVLLEQLGEAVARADMWESAAGEWRNTVERVTRERDEARDHAEACVDEALEAAAERAVKWWNGTNSSTASLRRAVMGDEE